MAKLQDGIGLGSEADIPPHKLEWLRAAAGSYLAGSDHIHQRVDDLAAPMTEWDMALLKEDFYPGDNDEDPDSRRFDPGSWIWAYLDNLHWEQFRAQLRSNLTAEVLAQVLDLG